MAPRRRAVPSGRAAAGELNGRPAAAANGASKAFVTSLSESLWAEQNTRGVYVMGLHPGPTTTRSQPRSGTSVPANLIQEPEQVAATAMADLRRRKRPTVISGRKNTLLAVATRAMPRRALTRMLSGGS